MAPNISSWLPRSLALPLPRKKSDDHHLPVTEKQRLHPPSSGIRHSRSISTASRVTISQSCFREEPTVVHTALSLREFLEREGFNEKKLTFIVAEGQQQWVKEGISRKIGAPGRLFAAAEWGPIALPQVYDGGMYFELDIPSLHNSSHPTRLRIYIHIRHRSTPTPTPSNRLQQTYSYYSRASYPPNSSTSPSSTTGPWITIIILTPHPPPKQKSTLPQNDSTLPTLLKRYYRTNNQSLTTRLTRNPSWILIDLLTLTGNLYGEAWMAEVPGGIPDWSFLFPHDMRRDRDDKWSWMFPGEKESRFHPGSQAEKAAVLFGYVDRLLGVVRNLEELRSVLESLAGLAQFLDLSTPGQGGGLGLGRRRNSYGSASIEEEPATTTTATSSLGNRNSSNPPQPPPPRNSHPLPLPPSPTSPTFSNSASSPAPTSTSSSTSTSTSTSTPSSTPTFTSSSSALKAQITTSTTHLAHFLAHLAALHSQAKNLQGMLSASNAIRQRGSLSTLAALGALLAPVGLVGVVFWIVGFRGGAEGEQGGRGADGWVYPIIGIVVVGVVGVVVGIVRRCGV
ncbi:hypothetical protein BGX38DRAFT_1144914 [Terfezia claveryi]|nr:hypothetical protein BGX38DRAFT_1144914 [Terfezia claveryi]